MEFLCGLLFLFISLCLSLWTVWWFVGVPLWSFISVYFSVFKFVDCVVVCWSSFVVFLFLFISLCLSLWTVWWFVGVPFWSVYSLFISLCLSLWTVWWFVGVPLWSFISVYFSVFKFVDCVVVCWSSLWSFYFCLFLCV